MSKTEAYTAYSLVTGSVIKKRRNTEFDRNQKRNQTETNKRKKTKKRHKKVIFDRKKIFCKFG